MPRASRYVLPGLVWHITHRCYRQQFLLKFQRDRANWRRWLLEARKREAKASSLPAVAVLTVDQAGKG